MTARRQLQHRPLAVAAATGLVVSWVVAEQPRVPGWERELTTVINGAPDTVATGLYPVMQLGTIGVPVVIALVILLWRRDEALAVGAMAAGLAAWFGAKAIKRTVERARPAELISGIDVREGAGTGLGFVSGHSAVAAVSAVMVATLLPGRWRPVAAALAAAVGLARIVHGVHLPADVVGGWSFGILVSLAALKLVDRIAPLPPAPSEEPT